MRSDPRDVARIVALSRATYRKMVRNLWWAAGYNVVAIPLAAGALAPLGIVLNPAVGAVLMSVSTIVVALNAQLLRRVQPDTLSFAHAFQPASAACATVPNGKQNQGRDDHNKRQAFGDSASRAYQSLLLVSWKPSAQPCGKKGNTLSPERPWISPAKYL